MEFNNQAVDGFIHKSDDEIEIFTGSKDDILCNQSPAYIYRRCEYATGNINKMFNIQSFGGWIHPIS
jgi:hypothetical protein